MTLHSNLLWFFVPWFVDGQCNASVCEPAVLVAAPSMLQVGVGVTRISASSNTEKTNVSNQANSGIDWFNYSFDMGFSAASHYWHNGVHKGLAMFSHIDEVKDNRKVEIQEARLHAASNRELWLGVLNELGRKVVIGIFSAVGGLIFLNALFFLYRWTKSREFNGSKVGLPLSFHSPDDRPRTFMQFPYQQILIGEILLYLWVVYFALGYIWMMIFCWLVYPVGYANSLGAPKFVIEAFGGWSGLVAPWLFIYTFVHFIWILIVQAKDAIRTQFMIPVGSMDHATHVVIEEEVSFLTDHELGDPDTEHDFFRLKDTYYRLIGMIQRAEQQTVLKIDTETDGTRQIEYTCVRYIYNEESGGFEEKGIKNCTPKQVHEAYRAGGLSRKEAENVLSSCGQNEIHVHVPGVIEALIVEFLDFTKVVASMGTWAYMVYSAANLGMVWFFITFGSGAYKALWITRPNQIENAALAKLEVDCKVLREGEWIDIRANEIVLGDIVQIDDYDEPKLPCDGIIIEGSIVTNESMLTGEPMPVQKMPVDDSDVATVAKRNIAHAGTKVLQSNGPADGNAVMIASAVGALTTRGQLVRMVLFPTSVRFKYIDQLPLVYFVLFVYMSILVFVYIKWVDVGGWVALYLLVINTCAMCVNPMLPVSVVMGQSVAAARLKKERNINCLQPGRIPVAGKISTMVFDKTGTITKEGMDFSAVVPIESRKFGPNVKFDDTNPESEANRSTVSNHVPARLRHALASCHTVVKMRDGTFIGNAVEVSMVRTCGWDLGDDLISSPSRGETLKVVKKLDFDHCRMTSGVVVRCEQTNELEVYVKGSYERIQTISLGESVPPDYDAKTAECAKDGFYTLGISTKTLPPGLTSQDLKDMTRDSLEVGLSLCGLLLFSNEMKSDSHNAIISLEEGSVRSVICTGDNALTGISIGKKCGIVKTKVVLLGDVESGQLVWRNPEDNMVLNLDGTDFQLGVTQGAWRLLCENKELLEKIWPRLVVFARMKPEDKINVVKYLQSQGLVVGFAGDGGNDCGGLRAAHAGMALSDAEASMVAPFSSNRDGKSLMTVVDMIREGRACLTTNLATFRFFLSYGFVLTLIRTFLVLRASLSLGEFVWLTNDIVFGIIMVSFMVQSKPQVKLSSYRPTATLFGWRTISAIAFPVLSAIAMMVIAYGVLWSSDFYVYVNPLSDLNLPGEKWMLKGDNYDSSLGAIFLFTVLPTVAFVNTYGGDFRLNIIHNWGMMVVHMVVILGLLPLTIFPSTQYSCLFRVNCGTDKSLESRELAPLALFSKLGGAGLVGGCFLGPMLAGWQEQLRLEGFPEEHWIPNSDDSCLPPKGFNVTPPFATKQFGCVGPNDCFSSTFQTTLTIILIIYVLLNHIFVKIVLQGPVATYLRERQRRRDRETHGEPHEL